MWDPKIGRTVLGLGGNLIMVQGAAGGFVDPVTCRRHPNPNNILKVPDTPTPERYIFNIKINQIDPIHPPHHLSLNETVNSHIPSGI